MSFGSGRLPAGRGSLSTSSRQSGGVYNRGMREPSFDVRPQSDGQRRSLSGGADHSQLGSRVVIAVVIATVVLVSIVARLFFVELAWGDDFREQAQAQRTVKQTMVAHRGAITDRSGKELAFTMQAKTLTVSPVVLRRELAEQARNELSARYEIPADTVDNGEVNDLLEQKLQKMARGIPQIVKDSKATDHASYSERSILDKLHANSNYEVLVRNVDPVVAQTAAEAFHGVAADPQPLRIYPNGAIGENVLGRVGMDGTGQYGFEEWGDEWLHGSNGIQSQEISTHGETIPGTFKEERVKRDGSQVQLTLDVDLQTYVQQQVEQSMKNSLAKGINVVVLDAKSGEVLAMANDSTSNPNEDYAKEERAGKRNDNPSISTPFEPGSVAKVITAAGTIEEGLTRPDEVLHVPGSIEMAGVTVSDAWDHGIVPYTTTGIFGKSSNVGTLMLAQRLGEERFDSYLKKFGIGESTGIELLGESQGLVPELEDWSGGSFANLPIGQGMSWTALQLASVYQTLANGGVRIPPRIVKSVTDPDGAEITVSSPGKKTRVVSEQTARTVVDMFRATTQSDPTGAQSGTAPTAAVQGYQTSGKTGTAQKVDPQTGAYSLSRYWITFAGLAPANDPRFVVAIMMDEPQRSSDGTGGQSAGPLFKEIASWILNRDNIPLSPPMEGQLILQAQ